MKRHSAPLSRLLNLPCRSSQQHRGPNWNLRTYEMERDSSQGTLPIYTNPMVWPEVTLRLTSTGHPLSDHIVSGLSQRVLIWRHGDTHFIHMAPQVEGLERKFQSGKDRRADLLLELRMYMYLHRTCRRMQACGLFPWSLPSFQQPGIGSRRGRQLKKPVCWHRLPGGGDNLCSVLHFRPAFSDPLSIHASDLGGFLSWRHFPE